MRTFNGAFAKIGRILSYADAMMQRIVPTSRFRIWPHTVVTWKRFALIGVTGTLMIIYILPSIVVAGWIFFSPTYQRLTSPAPVAVLLGDDAVTEWYIEEVGWNINPDSAGLFELHLELWRTLPISRPDALPGAVSTRHVLVRCKPWEFDEIHLKEVESYPIKPEFPIPYSAGGMTAR